MNPLVYVHKDSPGKTYVLEIIGPWTHWYGPFRYRWMARLVAWWLR